jgi:hypothetical protein
VREATLVAIDELGETVSRLCTDLLRGADTTRELRSAVIELGGLLERLERFDVSP